MHLVKIHPHDHDFYVSEMPRIKGLLEEDDN